MAMEDGAFTVRRPELEQALSACRRGSQGGALVTGEAGIGRTALARDVATRWAEEGGHVFWIGATESSRRFAFGALAGITAKLDPTDFGGSARLVFDSLSVAGALIVVDDAHLLDPASAALVHRMALLDNRPGLLVTVDCGQAPPDAVGRLTKDRLLEVVELGAFSREVTAAVLGGVLAGRVERPTCDRLFELSCGNPFVLRELVEAGVSAGVLQEKGGTWSWRGEVPDHPRLKDLVAVRLGRMAPDVQWMLQVLCLAEPLTLDQLWEAVGPDPVAAGEDAGLILVDRSGASAEVRFRHVLYSQLVRAALGKVRTLEAVKLLDTVLEGFPVRSSADRLKRAAIRLETGDRHVDDAEVFTEASRLARPDYGMAERFARAGLEAGGGFTALDYLVDALLWQGKIDDAKAAAEAVATDLSAEEYEYFSLRWSRMLWWMTGVRPDEPVDPDASIGHLSAAARLGSIARRAAMAATAGRGAEATSAALGVLADADADDEARCWAAGAAMIGLGAKGSLGDALRLSDDAFACARRLTDFNYRMLLSTVIVWLCRLSGNLERAQWTVDELRKEIGSRPDPNAGLVALSEAEIVLASGRLREAIPLLHDAALRLDETDFGGLAATAHLRLAECLARAGDVSGANVELDRGAELESRTLEMFRPEQLLVKAWARVATGDLKMARVLLGEARALAEAQSEQLVEVHVHHAGVRLGDRVAARRLLRLAPVVEGPFASSAALQARAFLDRSVGGLIEAGEHFADHGMAGEAADALAQAAKEAARADPLEAHRLASRAAAIAATAGGITTPALLAVVFDLPLTRRQREITALAATGLSNRGIADHLGIGVRTVESHLAAAYRRLGVNSRAELPGLLPH